MAFEQVIARLVGVLSVKVDKKSISTAQKQINKVAENMKKLAVTAGAGALAGGGFWLAMDSMRQYGQTLLNNAAILGTSTESLERWNHVANATGIEAETVRAAFGDLAKSQAKAAMGNLEAAAAYSKLEIDIRNADKSLKSQNQLMLEVADRLSGVKDSALRLRLAEQLLGRAGANFLPVLARGSKGIRRLLNDTDELGGVSSQKFLKAVSGWTEAIARFQLATRGAGQRIGARLIPFLTKITEFGARAANAFGKFIDQGQRIEAFVAIIGSALGIGLARALAPGLLALAPFIAAFGALFLLVEDFMVYQSGKGRSFFGYLAKALPEIWKGLITDPIDWKNHPVLAFFQELARMIENTATTVRNLKAELGFSTDKDYQAQLAKAMKAEGMRGIEGVGSALSVAATGKRPLDGTIDEQIANGIDAGFKKIFEGFGGISPISIQQLTIESQGEVDVPALQQLINKTAREQGAQ